jgi:hypothetical protein
MARYGNTFWCDNCGVEIAWVPLVEGRHHYCCQDCRDGYRCECTDTIESDEERRVPGTASNVLPAFYDQSY